MIQHLLRLDDAPKNDAADALAVALTHINHHKIKKLHS